MAISLTLDTSKLAGGPLTKAPQVIQKRLAASLNLVGVLMRPRFILAAPKDTRVLANAHKHAVDKKNLRLVLFNTKEHAVFVTQGRRAGAKIPPSKALRSWAARKLGNANLAFAVARSIAKKGIKPNPYFRNTIQNNEGLIRDTLQAGLDAAVKELNT